MAALLLLSNASAAPPLWPAQPDGARLERRLDRLLVVGNVLYVAAHPDDENTRLLAFLSNGMLLRTGYLSVTRGDGGQNLIGPELGPALGLIRTQELLAARALDGAEQLFTRARDFGYSKSPEESLAIWGHEAVLADVVLAIRRFRPDVVVSRFPTEWPQTHGQHTASARLALEAFSLAADPGYMPDAEHRRLGPWRAKRVVWNQSAGFGATEKELAPFPHLDAGGYDPWLGLSYGELAADSRSNHKSQGFGAARRRGPALEFFRPMAGEPMNSSPFDGLVLDWSRVPGTSKLVAELKRARADFRPGSPERALPGLLSARAELLSLPDNPWRAPKLAEIEEAILDCAGLAAEVTATVPSTARGATLPLTVTALARRPADLSLVEVRLPGRALAVGRPLQAGVPLEVKEDLRVPADAPITGPAWLELPPAPGLYPVSDPSLAGIPEEPAPLEAEFLLAIGGQSLRLRRPVAYKWVDPVLGERYRRVEVLPLVTVDPRDSLMVFPDPGPRSLAVAVRSVAGASGTLALEVPKGFAVSPAEVPFRLEPGGETVATFRVTPPRQATAGTLRAVATVEGRRFDRGLRRVEYAHIPVQTWLPPAEVRLTRADVAHSRSRVGYVPGPGDLVPDALRQAGYEVTLLGAAELREQPLDRFQALVFGVRAFNVEARLQALHRKLMEYVEAGGTVVVQYVTSNPVSGPPPELGPYPFTVGRARVTDENAAVEADPDPVLLAPNRIGEADWSGWVQERGLYFAEQWDGRYAAPLSMHDPGERPQRGALLVARVGKGTFVYTGLAFFRQLPAGVPGAFRLFANLLDHGA
ncbi:MAG TPA: PIG-L family deacetylase [Anaeromyxobacteraceae bacterium]|nr:PIG-L family deacetylase [Anaeromyxobacteraceae bacterium]